MNMLLGTSFMAGAMQQESSEKDLSQTTFAEIVIIDKPKKKVIEVKSPNPPLPLYQKVKWTS
jgi:hypothetical protein